MPACLQLFNTTGNPPLFRGLDYRTPAARQTLGLDFPVASAFTTTANKVVEFAMIETWQIGAALIHTLRIEAIAPFANRHGRETTGRLSVLGGAGQKDN